MIERQDKILPQCKQKTSIAFFWRMLFVLCWLLLGIPLSGYSRDGQTCIGSEKSPKLHSDRRYITINPDHHLVSAHLDNASMRWFLSQISKQTGIHVKISDQAVLSPVTLHCERLPLEAVLNRLLKNTSHTIVYGKKETGLVITDIQIQPQEEKISAVARPDNSSIPDAVAPILNQALESDAVPSGIKAALRHQARSNRTEIRETIEDSRFLVMDHLIDLLEQQGGALPQTISRLRRQNKIQNPLKTESNQK